MEEGEWTTVTKDNRRAQPGNCNRGHGRMDIAGNIKREQTTDTVTFYFIEFPDTHRAKEILRAFQLYDSAIEVVIPPKKNKRGRRFKFARFKNVRDLRILVVKLDNIIIGAKKIHVNLRFQREWNMLKELQSTYGHQRQYDLHQKDQAKWQWVEKGRRGKGQEIKEGYVEAATYAEAVKIGCMQITQSEAKVVYHRKNNLTELCYSVSDDEMQTFRNMYIGVVKNPGSTRVVQEWFNMQGFFSIKVTPLGANKVLLEEMDEGIILALISDAKDWIHEKFEDIRE